jgi:hypothetical protein
VLGGCCPPCHACSVSDCTLAGLCYACCCLADIPGLLRNVHDICGWPCVMCDLLFLKQSWLAGWACQLRAYALYNSFQWSVSLHYFSRQFFFCCHLASSSTVGVCSTICVVIVAVFSFSLARLAVGCRCSVVGMQRLSAVSGCFKPPGLAEQQLASIGCCWKGCFGDSRFVLEW